MAFAVSRPLAIKNSLASKIKPVVQTVTQAVSSVNNLLLTLTVALVEPLSGLGRFNLVFTVYVSALGLSRAMVVEPMLVGKIQATYPGAQKIVLIAGSIGAAILAVIGLCFGDGLFLALAASLPVLLFLDLVRYKHLKTGNPFTTLCMDIVWTGTLASAWIFRPPSAEYVVAYWSAGGLAALLIGLFWGGLNRWRPADVRSFFGVAKGISLPSALESLIFQFAWQLPFAVVLAILSLESAGEYRAAVTVMAPAGVVVASWTLSSYARLRIMVPDSNRVFSLATKISLLCCLYLLICLGFRENLGQLLFHSEAAVSMEILLLTGLQMPILAFGSQLAVWFKVQRLVKYVLLSRCISSIAVLLVIIAGLYWNYPIYVVASLPCGLVVHVVVLIVLRRKALRKNQVHPIPVHEYDNV